MWRFLIRKYRYKFFKLKLFLYRHFYDNILEFILGLFNRFKENQLKLPILYGNIITTFLLTFYIIDFSTMLKSLFMIFFYFLLNNYLFYDVGNGVKNTQITYCFFITISPVVSMLVTVKEELYFGVFGGIVIESLFFAFFNVIASVTISLALGIIILFILEYLERLYCKLSKKEVC